MLKYICFSYFFRETIRIINGFMKKHSLDFELQSRVRRYLEYTLKNESNIEEKNTILNKLTKSLRVEVLLQANGKFITNNKFFNVFSNETKEKIILSLKELRYSPEEYVYRVIFYIGLFKKQLNLFKGK